MEEPLNTFPPFPRCIGIWEGLKQNGLMYVVLGFIGIFGFNALFFLGMKHTSPVNGALIMATNPLVTAILPCISSIPPLPNVKGWESVFPARCNLGRNPRVTENHQQPYLLQW